MLFSLQIKDQTRLPIVLFFRIILCKLSTLCLFQCVLASILSLSGPFVAHLSMLLLSWAVILAKEHSFFHPTHFHHPGRVQSTPLHQQIHLRNHKIMLLISLIPGLLRALKGFQNLHIRRSFPAQYQERKQVTILGNNLCCFQ